VKVPQFALSAFVIYEELSFAWAMQCLHERYI